MHGTTNPKKNNIYVFRTDIRPTL